MESCWCGTFAAGVCVNCELPTCDGHSGPRRDGRWCSRCVTREQDNEAARREESLRKAEILIGDSWPALIAAAVHSQRPRHTSLAHCEHAEGWSARRPMPKACREGHDGCTLTGQTYRTRPSRQRTGRYERDVWTLAAIWTGGALEDAASEGGALEDGPTFTEIVLTPYGRVFIGEREIPASSLTPDDIPSPQSTEQGLEWFKRRSRDTGPLTREQAILAVHHALSDLADH